MSLHRLLFDTTSVETQDNTANVGAFLRSGSTGKLITNSSVTPQLPDTVTFVDGDVTVGTDSINIAAHNLETGDLIQLTTTGVLPAGLALVTDYFVIRTDDDNIKLAANLADAEAGTPVDVTAAAGGGTHSVVSQDNTKCSLDVRVTKTSIENNEDAAHTSGDTGVMSLAVRNDTEGTLADTDGDYAPLQVDSSGRLRVVADLDVTNLSEKAEDSAHTTGDIGDYVLSVRVDDISADNSALLAGTNGDYQSFLTNTKGEHHVIDTDGNALLTTIDTVLDNILLDTNAIVVDLAAIEIEQLAQGVTLDAILVDTTAIAADTAAMVIDLAAIEIEQLAQGVTLDAILVDTTTIAGDTTSIDATLTALSKAEDSVHASGDQGIQALAVRNDARTALAADGDYIPLITNDVGELFVHDTDVLAELNGLTHNEDDAHVSGDKGVMTLAVQSATTGALAGDGDYTALQTSAIGDLRMIDIADTALATAAETVNDTSSKLITTDLTNRKSTMLYNNGNQNSYIGPSGVTDTTGFPLFPGSMLETKIGAAVAIHAVAETGKTTEVRVLQAS